MLKYSFFSTRFFVRTPKKVKYSKNVIKQNVWSFWSSLKKGNYILLYFGERIGKQKFYLLWYYSYQNKKYINFTFINSFYSNIHTDLWISMQIILLAFTYLSFGQYVNISVFIYIMTFRSVCKCFLWLLWSFIRFL